MSSTKTTPLMKPVFVLLFTFAFIVLSSFNERQPPLRTQASPAKAPADELESLGVFNLDYSKFLSLGGSWDRRLILQFITTATDAGNKYDVAAFLATSQEDHGTSESPILLTSQSSLGLNLTKDKTYYIGNNYVRMRSIKRYIRAITDDNGEKAIKYLKFTAVSWIGKSPDHIFFLIQAFDESNNLLKTDNTGIYADKTGTDQEGGVLTNPSPPADPTTDQ